MSADTMLRNYFNSCPLCRAKKPIVMSIVLKNGMLMREWRHGREPCSKARWTWELVWCMKETWRLR